MKSKIFLAILLTLGYYSFAQTKVGTVDSDYIVNLMPQTKKAIERSRLYGAKLDTTFNAKVTTYKTKIEAFKKAEKTLTTEDRKTKINELAGLEQDIKKYQQNGNALMQLRKSELMRPIYKKVGEIISEVAKANGYTQILTLKGNEFAYIDPKFDITKLVMDRLGLKEPENSKK